MSKIQAFPLLTIDHFITRETKRLSSNDNDLYDLLPPLSLSLTELHLPTSLGPVNSPRAAAAAAAQANHQPNATATPCRHCLSTFIACPIQPDSFRHLLFSLALIPLSPVSNNLRPAPRRGATDKRRGPFWFSSMIASQHAFPSFVLPCPAHLLITFFYFLRFSLTLAFISLKRVELGWGGGHETCAWKWTLEPEKASTGLDWMGWNIVKRKASTRWQDKKKKKNLGIGEKRSKLTKDGKTPQPIVCIIDGQMSFPFLVLTFVCSRYTFLFVLLTSRVIPANFLLSQKFKKLQHHLLQSHSDYSDR
jgi:hypothetical protein